MHVHRLITLALLATVACSNNSSSGSSAGKAGDACVPSLQNEGCQKTTGQPDKRMRCDKSTEKWITVETCSAGNQCVTWEDPAAAGGGQLVPPMLSKCKADVDGGATGNPDGVSVAGTPDIQVRIGEELINNYTFPWSEPSKGPKVVEVQITNHGTGSATLEAVHWATNNPALTMLVQDRSHPLPLALTNGMTVVVRIQYDPAHNTGSTYAGQLSLQWAPGVKAAKSVSFYSPPVAGTACADDIAGYTFWMTPEGDTIARCFQVYNCGKAPLKFVSVQLEQTLDHFEVTSAPDSDDVLPPLGAANSPAAAPLSFSVCVNAKPDTSGQAKSGKVKVLTNDPKGALSFPLTTAWATPPAFSLKCDASDIALLVNWKKSNQVVCTLESTGGDALLIKEATIQPWHANLNATVASLYKLTTYYKANGSSNPGTPPKPLLLGQGAQLVMGIQRMKDQPSGQPGAYVHIIYSRGDGDRTARIPIHAATCDVPHLLHSHAGSGLFLHAPVGGAASTKLVLHVPTCAPTNLMFLCTSQYGGSNPTSMCGGGKISPYVIHSPVVYKGTLPKHSLTAFTINLAKIGEPLALGSHFVSTYWCQGTGTTSVCKGKAFKENYAAWYHIGVAPDLDPPTVLHPFNTPKKGHAIQLIASAHQSLWPVPKDGGWRWHLVSRPPGSTAWIHAEHQLSATPVLHFLPDAVGKYEIAVAHKIVNPNNTLQFQWSPDAIVKLSVSN